MSEFARYYYNFLKAFFKNFGTFFSSIGKAFGKWFGTDIKNYFKDLVWCEKIQNYVEGIR